MKDENKPESLDTSKQSYVRPSLKELGEVKDITQGPQGGNVDGAFGSTGGFQPPDGS